MKKLLIIFSIIVIIIIFIKYLRLVNSDYKLCKEYKPLKVEEKNELLRLLKDIHDFCEEKGIKYFLIGGSLLGAIRNNGIIPWDDDIDISFLEEDYQKFKEVNDKFVWDDVPTCRRLKYKEKSYPFIDVFIMKRIENKYVYRNELARKFWPKEYLVSDEIYPLKKHKFEDMEVYIPDKSKNFLDRSYPDWDKFGIVNYINHRDILDLDYWTKFLFCKKQHRIVKFFNNKN